MMYYISLLTTHSVLFASSHQSRQQNFQYAGVHVKPVALNAVFFSYIDPSTNLTDPGLTSHSGCPVYEGEKKIVTQWVRLGVSKEVDWKSFNTLGVPKSDEDE
jgi:hypothetical protein